MQHSQLARLDGLSIGWAPTLQVAVTDTLQDTEIHFLENNFQLSCIT